MDIGPNNPPTPRNTAAKRDMGQMQDPLSSAMNAFLTQMSGTNYNMNKAAETVAPPRQPGGTFPNGMMVGVGQMPPVPEANPMFHPQSPLEYDLGALFAQSMQGQQIPMIHPSMMAMGEIPNNPEIAPTPNVPTLKPPLPAKPERSVGKGGPSTEPKQITKAPKRKRMIAEK